MENIIICSATTDDWVVLQEIGRKTFYETFASSNTPENMEKYLKDGFSEEKLRKELNNEDSQFYLALLNHRVIGYLKLNLGLSQTEMQDSSSLEIERIYVLQEFQGKKVGQVLYSKAMEIALHLDVDYVWLGVWEENKKAISFYTKNGFIAFDQHIFKLGDEEQTDIMMKKILKADPS
ncbi:GNAT family N-acetyltransferase [Niabella hibiscisoli]|uniref:GNAT family N-acetyltransferase n=1 Tax=Niabella hibiscisoli TaxID=1825928 RepID=UPI001F1038D3|nr:GNAT family N-acetyltransferase [Niabella hibiscisoli]MCH5720030.1 GNAT family N-acetyltransferase [Niabella hibiscisoli]